MSKNQKSIYAFISRLLSQKVRSTTGKTLNRYHYSHRCGSKTFKMNKRKGL